MKKDQKLDSVKVGICIPCHNEADIIEKTIKTVKKYLSSDAFPYPSLLIIVDDGSSDNTFEIAKKAGADVLYRHPTNQGLGGATRTGMEVAHYIGCTQFVKFDADLQHDVDDIFKTVKPVVEDKFDVVYASRFAGKINYRMPIVRFLGNHFFSWLMRRITGWKVSDAQTGLMCLSRRYLTVFETPCTYNTAQQTLFDSSVKGMRYGEVPAVFHKRETGKSFISWWYINKVLVTLSKMAFFHYGFSMFTIPGLILIVSGMVVAIKGLIGYFFFHAAHYLPNSTWVLFAFITGILSILFGLQSFSQTNRSTSVRNSKSNYRYISLEEIIYC